MTAPLPPWPVMRTPNIAEHGPLEAVAMVMNDERSRAEAAIARMKLAQEALSTIAAQNSGKPGSTARADCMAIMAKVALEQIGEIP